MCDINKIDLGYGEIRLKNGTILKDEGEVLEYINKNESSLIRLTVKDLQQLGIYIGASVKGMKKDDIIKKLLLFTRIKLSNKTGTIPDKVYCVFDTETTIGFGTGRLLQLGYAIFEKNIKVYESQRLVSPCDFKVTGSDIHNITEEIAIEFGEPMKDVLMDFILKCNEFNVNVLVAHNSVFDLDVIERECITSGIKLFSENETKKDSLSFYTYLIDTMRFSSVMQYYKIKNNLTRAVFPKLEKLYITIFDENIEVPHSALEDAKITAKCLFQLFRLNVITLNDFQRASKQKAIL